MEVLYLLGHDTFRLRDVGSVIVRGLVTADAAFALVPPAVWAPAVVTLAVLVIPFVGLAVYETAYSPIRNEVREG